MSSFVEYCGKCQCGKINYTVPYEPEAIANCHCTICQKLHNKPFVSFAKYNTREVIIKGKENLNWHRSSTRASRGYCNTCRTLFLMYYDDSENIWINTDTFNFRTYFIEHYDIYTDTAVF